MARVSAYQDSRQVVAVIAALPIFGPLVIQFISVFSGGGGFMEAIFGLPFDILMLLILASPVLVLMYGMYDRRRYAFLGSAVVMPTVWLVGISNLTNRPWLDVVGSTIMATAVIIAALMAVFYLRAFRGLPKRKARHGKRA